jgi:ribose transport system ATP-binding protein
MGMSETNETMLEMQKISKSFPGVQALDQVDFNCVEGEVHALVGENGAGKSTLMKILAGVYQQDEGKIFLRGKEVSFTSPKDAQKNGISTIYQEFNLIPDLNVAENIFLGHEPLKKRGFFIDGAKCYRVAEEILSNLEMEINTQTKVGDLSVAEQQMVEIAKALCLKANIIIMDEPTAVISGKELEALFRIIRLLRDDGKTIIYISHRIDEIFGIADRATVLKDGKLVGTIIPKDVSKGDLVRMMVGRSLSEVFPSKEPGQKREILTLKNVCRGRTLRNISFSVNTGEILGVTGLVGCGRTELARVIFGADPLDRGDIYFNGQKRYRNKPKLSISRGMGFVTEDRKKEGLFPNLSVRKNLTSVILSRVKGWFFVKEREERRIATESIKRFNIMTPHIEQEVQYLSGGNQQKVILAKWINADSKLIIMDEPTRGVDVGAKAEFYTLMRLLARQGKAILMISSEFPEIIGMSDRILVMHDGQIMGELCSSEATEESILMMATGQLKKNKAEEELCES